MDAELKCPAREGGPVALCHFCKWIAGGPSELCLKMQEAYEKEQLEGCNDSRTD